MFIQWWSCLKVLFLEYMLTFNSLDCMTGQCGKYCDKGKPESLQDLAVSVPNLGMLREVKVQCWGHFCAAVRAWEHGHRELQYLPVWLEIRCKRNFSQRCNYLLPLPFFPSFLHWVSTKYCLICLDFCLLTAATFSTLPSCIVFPHF